MLAIATTSERIVRSQRLSARGRRRGRFFNIDLINKLEADSRAAGPHRQLASLRFDQLV
jgi:hypothetical protein